MNKRLVIDWLTMVTLKHTPDELKVYFGIDHLSWAVLPGMWGYLFRQSHENIHILYGASEEMGVCICMSGQGCRLFEALGHGNYLTVFNDVLQDEGRMWFTRLDIAYDDFDGLDMQTIFKDCSAHNYVGRFRSYNFAQSDTGFSCTFGSPSSLIRIRIYDKLAEQSSRKFMTIDCPPGISSWCRIEIQFNKERSMDFVKAFSKGGFKDIHAIFFGVLAQYLRFVSRPEACRGDGDERKRRWPTASYWEQFYNDVEKIQLYFQEEPLYTLDKVKDYVLRQAIGPAKTLLEILGERDFVDVLKSLNFPRNPKYKNLIYQEACRASSGGYDENTDELRF